MLQPFWTGGTPPREARTHVWDVSGTEWEEYDKGKVLKSPPFSCAGVHGLYIQFYPKGKDKSQPNCASLHLHIDTQHDRVVVQFAITVDGQRCEAWRFRSLSRGHGWNNLPHKPAYSIITVELLDVKCKYQNNFRLECSTGDILRVTASEQTAQESFCFVGCTSYFHNCMKNLLGQTGKVLKVTAKGVWLEHDDGSHHRWGHLALERLNKFTGAEVDAMKVRLRQHASRGCCPLATRNGIETLSVDGMQVVELKKHLKERKLSLSGLKPELAERLMNAELSRTVSQAKSPTARAAGAVDPGDVLTARKVRSVCTGFAKCTGDD